ncbi:MAG TPA: type IV secretion system DNA-binding domain-containing protein, partial [Candidatus Paceibacterota bacterium]|nr:type IV secretion system DNA-binding domain-containing protein [Candidatus Paceibacterota bacterium]
GLVLGQSIFRGVEKTIRVTDEDRRRHTYIIGQTGTGKSVFIQNMAMQDMKEGKGFCVIDPHGELVDKILNFVPASRIDDVIIFDPGDRSRPLGLNMLEYNLSRPEEKTFIVNELQAIFNQLFMKETMGPQFEKYMRNTLLLLMDDFKNEPATLMEVPRVFTDEEYRRRKLANCTTPLVVDFWTKEVPKTSGEQSLGNFAPYITSKFDGFISNDYLRPIIGQTKSSFNFRQAMDEGKIILVNLSKGKLGDLNSALLGMLIVGKLLQAALSRVDVADEKVRRDFYLYIDEFQNYTTDSIATILSEARKYRLNLTIAHQFIAQLKDNIRESVFGNVGNLVAMRVGPPDAEVLVKHFGPVFSERDLISIENLNAYVKILVDGQPSEPFNIKFKWAEGGSSEVRKQMKELSRLRYGHDLQTVEEDIVRRLRD